MPAEKKLRVVLCWHMHQPQYRDLVTGEYQLPWTYLHATKDYVDMAAHLEAVPGARAVVNFAPVLLEQLADYAVQLKGFLDEGKCLHDPLLAALASPTLPASQEARLALVKACLRVNDQRVIQRFRPYARLAEMAAWFQQHPDGMMYLDEQFLADLLVWYHLGWIAETVRRTDLRIESLQKKASMYSLKDRCSLLHVISELISGVIPRYRALAEQGRVELSVSPYAHPIVPLMLDINSAREAMPEVQLPLVKEYPDGEARARWHLQQGIDVFERHFGFRPAGCWPSEGSVSTPTLALLDSFGFQWAATGESVLHNSANASGIGAGESRDQVLHRPYRLPDINTACFFRDDGLSDMVGFNYSDWHADDAVANFLHHLENIANSLPATTDAVVSVILDGENAWEYYPENGYHFLDALYRGLAEHPQLDLTTYSQCLQAGVTPAPLPRLVAGSWVYGTFSTWIGDRDKNRGWEMLVDARQAFDRASRHGLSAERLQAATLQLAICEGSDWFWWFGDYNPAGTVNDFDRLFRLHLSNLYHLLGMMPPDYLAHSFTHGSGDPVKGGVMRHGQAG